MPGRHQQRHSGSPRPAAGLAWSSGLRQGFQVAYQYQQVALEKSLQTLQRVGTLIRSTSVDCMSALGTKKQASRGLPPPGQQPPEDEQQQAAGQSSARLSRFITTASNAEVAAAAMLSDLSNLAYDVQAISAQRLRDTHSLSLVAHSKQAMAQLLPSGSAAARAQLQAAADADAAAPIAQPASSQLLQALPRPAAVRRRSQEAAVQAGMPQSPAAAGAAPGGFSAYLTSSASFGQSGSAPTSPRTPFVLSSFAETDDAPSPADAQLATASGAVSSPSTPRRASSALSAAAPSRSGSLAAAPAGIDVPLLQLQSSGSAGAALAAQLMQYQLQDVEALPAAQYQLAGDAAEQQAMLDLQQQEQLVLLEMQHTQQLQALLQQEQAIMQQLQEQASLASMDAADDTESSADVAAGGNGSSNAWWWLQQLQRQAAAATALATAAAAPNAAAAAARSSADVPKPDAPPSDWFVCDGPGADGSNAAPIRYFVIQGSITLDHWRINLTIDPCEFEGGALGGVKVHRGVYEAALEMLDVFVPYVTEHLAQHPDGMIAFTGHSLGGSLATLLMLLLVHRGILPAANVATVRTFGAPAIFCEGATGSPPAAGSCQSCSLPCQHRKERSAASAAAGAAAAAAHGAATADDAAHTGGLLGKLGLAHEKVVNVVMTRDIVPRAFVCDYTLVAELLKSWLPSFKEHVGLADCKEHKALYNFIGTIEVLQPSAACPFVLPDEGLSSMLPEQAALYKLTEPCCNLPDPAAAAAAEEEAERPSFAEFLAQAAANPCSGCGGSCSGSCSSSHACGSASACQELDSSSCSSSQQAADDSSSSGRVKKGKLGNFGSWGSLTSLSNLSLTSAIADLTSRFTLTAGNSGSIVSVPVTAEEAATEAAAAAVCQAVTVAEAAAQDDVPAEVAAAYLAAPAAAAAAVADAGSSSSAQPQTLGDAILTFMNSPHPLETLGEMRAYGPAGQISRFHNPNSYTVGLQQLCGVRVYEHSQ
uniref:Fungal lipase-type domain-containing protein n=1 Tax=Tetradesmus obliquus TaxID=3088 RepID=A0A383V8M5_TETOB|eukprot:jgi/Sobl393_1/13681/SZX78677.1